jgi:hypothetical protein
MPSPWKARQILKIVDNLPRQAVSIAAKLIYNCLQNTRMAEAQVCRSAPVSGISSESMSRHKTWLYTKKVCGGPNRDPIFPPRLR